MQKRRQRESKAFGKLSLERYENTSDRRLFRKTGTGAGSRGWDSYKLEEVAGRPQEQSTSANFKSAGWHVLSGRGPAEWSLCPPGRPGCTSETRSLEPRPNPGSGLGCGHRRTFQSRSRQENWDPENGGGGGGKGPTEECQQGPHSASPSHGELDHSKSGARPTQLRLEIWIAADRLHSHHPHRQPGRAAATLPASKLKKKGRERPWTGCGRPGPGRERRPRRVVPGARSAESRQGADEPRGRRRAGRGARGTRRAAPSSHRAEGASALARLTSFPRLPFACSPEPCATGMAQALALAQTQTQTQAVRVGGAAGVLNLIP